MTNETQGADSAERTAGEAKPHPFPLIGRPSDDILYAALEWLKQTKDGADNLGIQLKATAADYAVRSLLLAPSSPGVPDSVRALSEAATKGEWYTESEKCDGSYGSGEDCSEGYLAYSILTDAERPYGNPGVIAETSNSTLGVIHEESDEDGHTAWDETARANTAFIVAAVNFVRHQISAHPAGQSTGQGAETDALVDRFAAALKAKLRAAEAKYGWQNGWLKDDWAADCQRDLMRHVGKGDPLDVAAYAAFCWHHGWPTAPDSTRTGQVETEAAAAHQRDMALEALHTLGVRIGLLDPSVAWDGPQLLAAIDAYSDELAARPEAPEAQGAWIKTPERFVIAVKEFLADWRKGDFSLPKLAELDAESIEAALEDWASRLPAPPAPSAQESE